MTPQDDGHDGGPVPKGGGAPAGAPIIVHASCVAVDGKAVLIQGATGSGKSTLALQLIALGADLVADDRTELTLQGERVIANCPDPIRGQIEARGVGILAAPPCDSAELQLIVDLSQHETMRLPPTRNRSVFGKDFALILGGQAAHLAPAIILHLKHGRIA